LIRVVPARVKIYQPKIAHIAVLPGVSVLGGQGTVGVAALPPGLVADFRKLISTGIGGHGSAAQVVGQRIVHHPIQPGCQAHAASIVIAGGLAGCPHLPFSVVTHKTLVDGVTFCVLSFTFIFPLLSHDFSLYNSPTASEANPPYN